MFSKPIPNIHGLSRVAERELQIGPILLMSHVAICITQV